MKRGPSALPAVCSPGSALAQEVQAAGSGAGPPSLQQGWGRWGNSAGLVSSALSTEGEGAGCC